MATIKLGMLVSQLAGSIGGTTFRRGNGFIAMQNKTKGASKAKLLKNPALARMGSIVKQWLLIPPADREEWNAKSFLFQFPDKFGDMKYLSGRQLFIKLTNHSFNVGGTYIDPFALTSAVPISVAVAWEIQTPETAEIEVVVDDPIPLVVISAEIIKSKGILPVYNKRQILHSATPNAFGIVSFGPQLFNKFPLLKTNDIVRVYYYSQNNFGFKTFSQYVDIIVNEIREEK